MRGISPKSFGLFMRTLREKEKKGAKNCKYTTKDATNPKKMSLLLLNDTMAMVSVRDYDLSHPTDESYSTLKSLRVLLYAPVGIAFIV